MKVFVVSLGCDKNLVDSEKMLGFLKFKNYELTDDENLAEIIIVNTCSFINDAKEESITTILEMANYKKIGVCKILLVTGCLGQRFSEDILREIPEVDGILGTNDYQHLQDVITAAFEGEKKVYKDSIDKMVPLPGKRMMSAPGHVAYLKIAEGCDKHCTYCIIPTMRGHYRSFPMEDLIKEATMLAQNGVKELILVAQETTLYGTDLYEGKKLPDLLDQLNQIEGLRWIRLLYCYPEEIDQPLIDAMIRNEKVCHYLDMPIQHASNHMLTQMGRKTSKEDIINTITSLRTQISDICLRTTLITGFPGETLDDHEEMIDFVKNMKFDRLGIFTYSPEDGTPAATYSNQIDEQVKIDYKNELMAISEQAIFDKTASYVGQSLEVIVEGYVSDEHTYVARSYRDAPEIDGYVFINTDEQLMTGQMVTVNIVAVYEYDMIGEL